MVRNINYSIEYLYKTYKNDVYSYLISFTKNKTLSEDLTSDVFLTAILSLPKFKGNSTIKTWLFGIARNKWYEQLKKKQKDITDEYLMELYTFSDYDISENICTHECIKRIYEILSELKPKQKDIFLLRTKGYSYAEIAEKENISESSARVTDFRVKNKLKEILIKEEYYNE